MCLSFVGSTDEFLVRLSARPFVGRQEYLAQAILFSWPHGSAISRVMAKTVNGVKENVRAPLNLYLCELASHEG